MLNELVADLVGLPYAHNGRDKSIGFDCYGLVREVAKRSGCDTPDYDSPKDNPSFLETIKSEGPDEYYKILDNPEPGCVVTLRVRFPFTTHIGVVLDDCNHFIHVMRSRNVCIERLNSPFWRDRITGYYKWTKSS